MAYSILSNDTRQQIEQERSRLINDRDTILASVTAEIDRAVQYLDALLETEAAPTESTSATSNGAAPIGAKRRLGKAKVAASNSSAEDADAAPKPVQNEPKPKRQPSVKRREQIAFDPKQLKREFNGMTSSEAMLQLMQRDLQQTFATDDANTTWSEACVELYGDIDAADISRARKSVSAMLMQGARAHRFEKVQDSPARYKLSESAVASA